MHLPPDIEHQHMLSLQAKPTIPQHQTSMMHMVTIAVMSNKMKHAPHKGERDIEQDSKTVAATATMILTVTVTMTVSVATTMTMTITVSMNDMYGTGCRHSNI